MVIDVYRNNKDYYLDDIYIKIQSLIKENLKDYIYIFKKYNIFLAGGSLLRTINDELRTRKKIFSTLSPAMMETNEYYDYDLYSDSYENIKNCIDELLNIYPKLRIQYKTSTSITLGDGSEYFKLQFIHNKQFIGKCENIISNFDFSVCQIAYLFKTDILKITEEFRNTYASKEIIYNEKSKHPISSLMRLSKYADRGYNFSIMEKLKIIFSIANLNIKTFGDLASSLQGVSASYFKDYLEFLDSNDMREKKFSLESFIKNFDEYKEAKEILEKLENH